MSDTKEKITKIEEDVKERAENLEERKREIEETNKVTNIILGETKTVVTLVTMNLLVSNRSSTFTESWTS